MIFVNISKYSYVENYIYGICCSFLQSKIYSEFVNIDQEKFEDFNMGSRLPILEECRVISEICFAFFLFSFII